MLLKIIGYYSQRAPFLLFLVKLNLRENVFLFSFYSRVYFRLRGPVLPFDVDENRDAKHHSYE